MTTFTFNFISSLAYRESSCLGKLSAPWMIAAFAICLVTLTVSCSNRSSNTSAENSSRQASLNTKPADELLARLRENFDLATQGAPGPWTRMTELPKVTSAGIDCNPAQLNRRNASLQLVLPSRREDRYAVLAAIVPDGGLRIIYIAYGDDTDPEDLIIPSKSLDWESAKEHNNFRLDVRSFDALFSGTNESMPLFRQAGVYQFALLNSLDRELLAVNQHEFEVKAGCVVHWTP